MLPDLPVILLDLSLWQVGFKKYVKSMEMHHEKKWKKREKTE